MRTNRTGWALFGFLVGLGLGSGFGYLALLLYNLVLRWLDKPSIAITWGQVLPLGILMGLGIAINMVNNIFGD